MPQPVLDIVALRSLTAIADCGGFHRAARAPALSQSAVSQHVRPGCRVRFRIDRSARLVETVERGSVTVAVYVTEAAATEGTPVDGLPLTWHAAPAPVPLVAIEDPCAIRRRAIATLAAHGVAAVVGDAGYLAGVLDIARTGQGVALLAAVGPAPDGLSPYGGLPPVTPIPMSALARPGTDPATDAAAFDAVRDLLR
ncbi:LysR family transcriptional regulator [Streptomyces sp. NPDC055400]